MPIDLESGKFNPPPFLGNEKLEELVQKFPLTQEFIDAIQRDLTVNTEALNKGNNFGRNLITNGNFHNWQRATTQTASGWGSVDMFRCFVTGSSQVVSRQNFLPGFTEIPNNSKHYFRNTVTSVAGAGNFVATEHYIENLVRFSGKKCVFTFWARADSPKNIAVDFFQYFGLGGSPSPTVYLDPFTYSLTTTWQKFTTIVEFPSLVGKVLGNTYDAIGFTFWFDAGSNFNSRTNSLGHQSGVFDIADIQLEEGEIVTEFEYVSPSEQLPKCQRYFQDSGGYIRHEIMTHYSSTDRYNWINFPVTMAEIPNITINNLALYKNGANLTGTITSQVITQVTKSGFSLIVRSTNTTNQGGAALIYIDWEADAGLT